MCCKTECLSLTLCGDVRINSDVVLYLMVLFFTSLLYFSEDDFKALPSPSVFTLEKKSFSE